MNSCENSLFKSTCKTWPIVLSNSISKITETSSNNRNKAHEKQRILLVQRCRKPIHASYWTWWKNCLETIKTLKHTNTHTLHAHTLDSCKKLHHFLMQRQQTRLYNTLIMTTLWFLAVHCMHTYDQLLYDDTLHTVSSFKTWHLYQS